MAIGAPGCPDPEKRRAAELLPGRRRRPCSCSLYLAVVIVWYKVPYKVDKNYLASSIDGTTINISIEMKGYRNIFIPTVFDGEMIVNDHVYKTIKN